MEDRRRGIYTATSGFIEVLVQFIGTWYHSAIAYLCAEIAVLPIIRDGAQCKIAQEVICFCANSNTCDLNQAQLPYYFTL